MRKYSHAIIEKLIVQQGHCFYCGFPMPLRTKHKALSITKDHFYPKSKGNGEKRNIVLCHLACNQQKAAMDPTKKQVQHFMDFRGQLRRHRKELNAFNDDFNQFKRIKEE